MVSSGTLDRPDRTDPGAGGMLRIADRGPGSNHGWRRPLLPPGVAQGFLADHAVRFLPDSDNSTFPLLAEMWYAWALALDGPVAAA